MKRILISLTVFLALWKIISLLLQIPVLPSPEGVFVEMISELASGRLGPHLLISYARVAAALVLSFAPASVLGLASGLSGRINAVVSPGVYLLFPIPKVALLPVILLFLGLGNLSKIFFVALILFFPFFLHIRDGAASLNQRFFDSLKTLGGTRRHTLRHILIPGLLPRLFSALRMNLGTAVAVLFLAETFATRRGIGWYIMDSWSRISYVQMYAGIMALSLVSLIIFLILDRLEELVCPWVK